MNQRQRKWDDRFLDLAQFISQWSLDPNTKVGAVIADFEQRIVSLGYNGLPRGVHDLPKRLHDRDIKLKMTVHGELNAIIFAKRPLDECTLYTWPFMPCAPCAAMVIQSGIRRVVAPVSDNPRWIYDFRLSTEMFNETGVELCLIDPP